MLVLALYRSGRQGDALAVLRRARTLLAERLGVEPGPALRRLEADILDHAGHLEPALGPGGAAARVWAQAAAAYDRTVASGARARLESTVGLLRDLAVTGGDGLEAARRHRVAAVAAAEELGDPELTARVIGAYDVPAIWTRLDDPEQAARVVTAAERTLTALPPDGHEAARARLLATVALESRGIRSARGPQAARQAEEIARRLDDPALLAFALNGVFMHTFHRAGSGPAPGRDRRRAHRPVRPARPGHLRGARTPHPSPSPRRPRGLRLGRRARDRRGPPGRAPRDTAGGRVTQWYRALRLAATDQAPAAEAAYQAAAARLDGAGMPGLERGLLPLALLCMRLRQARRAQTDEPIDWGPYAPWARPQVLLAQGRRAEAAAALRQVPDPPRDLLFEALWCLTARTALAVGDRETMERAHTELTPAAAELAGAGSGLLTLGPVSHHLDALTTALRHPR